MRQVPAVRKLACTVLMLAAVLMLLPPVGRDCRRAALEYRPRLCYVACRIEKPKEYI